MKTTANICRMQEFIRRMTNLLESSCSVICVKVLGKWNICRRQNYKQKYLLIQLEPPPSIHPTQEIKSKSVETLNVISCITVQLSRTAIVSQCPIQTNYNNRSLSGKYQCLFYSATHQKCVQSAALLHFALLCSILLCTVPQKFSSRSAAIRHLGCALGDFPLLCKACLVWELLFSTIFRRHSPSTHNPSTLPQAHIKWFQATGTVSSNNRLL